MLLGLGQALASLSAGFGETFSVIGVRVGEEEASLEAFLVIGVRGGEEEASLAIGREDLLGPGTGDEGYARVH